MKKTCTQLLAIALCLIMCLSAAGCDADLGAVLLVKKAYDAVLEAKSFGISVTAEAVATAAEEKVRLKVKADGAYTKEPVALMLNAEVDGIGQSKMELPLYLMNENGIPALYLGVDIAGYTVWFKTELNVPEETFSNGAQGMIQYLKDCSNLVSRGKSEKLDGVSATPLTVVIPGELLMLKNEQGEVVKGKADIENLSVTIWIDDKSNLPIKLEGDLKSLAQYYLEQLKVDILPAITVESLPVTISLYDYDKVETIELPENAKNAIELEREELEAGIGKVTETPASMTPGTATPVPMPTADILPSAAPAPSTAPSATPKPSVSPSPAIPTPTEASKKTV